MINKEELENEMKYLEVKMEAFQYIYDNIGNIKKFETLLPELRNALGPIVNYFAMVEHLREMELDNKSEEYKKQYLKIMQREEKMVLETALPRVLNLIKTK